MVGIEGEVVRGVVVIALLGVAVVIVVEAL